MSSLGMVDHSLGGDLDISVLFNRQCSHGLQPKIELGCRNMIHFSNRYRTGYRKPPQIQQRESEEKTGKRSAVQKRDKVQVSTKRVY